MEENISNTINLSKEEETKIIKYCRNKLYEVKSYLDNCKSIEQVENTLKDFAEADFTDSEKIDDDIHHFTFIFDQIMISGYVTLYGVMLSKIVSYNTFNDNCDLYCVDIENHKIELM